MEARYPTGIGAFGFREPGMVDRTQRMGPRERRRIIALGTMKSEGTAFMRYITDIYTPVVLIS